MLNASPEQRCPRCQALLAPDAAVCPNCGLNLSAPADESLNTNSFPSVPPTVSEPDGATPPAEPSGMSTESLEMPTYEAPTEAQMGVPAAGSAEAFAPPPATFFQQGQPFAPPAPPAQPKVRLSRKAILIALAILILLGASGGLAYILTRPNPVISVTNSTGGSTLTGSPDTVLHVSVQHFSGNATITFLLDGNPAPGAPKVRSDPSGNVQKDLTITDDWPFGSHMLTAKDDQGYMTKMGVSLKVIPAPVLMITSPYTMGQAAVASQVVPIQISGKRFTPSSAIALLLDGNPLSGSQPITSDQKGRFALNLTPTDWTVGNHTLTAKDSQGYSTQQAASVVIVVPGQAGTPGPNGAPADNASFALDISVQAQDARTGQSEGSFEVFLKVTGRPDPAGGMPCDTTYDNGQPEVSTGDFGGGLTYKETTIYGCSGSYQSGKLKYVEVLVSERFDLSDGETCNSRTINLPYRTYEGAFSSASSISGSYSAVGLIITCTGSTYIQIDASTGTWTSTI